MSSPGFFTGDQDPADMARTQMMASILQGKQQQGQQNPFGGIGNAIAMKALQNRQAQDAYNRAPPTTAALSIPGMTANDQLNTLSTKMPYMGPQGLSGLFNFGGG